MSAKMLRSPVSGAREEITMKLLALFTASLCAVATVSARAHDIIRHANPNVPIASSVMVPEGTDLLFVSGTLADVANPSAPAGSIERLGDTATQAKSVLGKIAKELEASGFTMADVVKMNVYLVGDPRKGGTMDFEGLMKAYLQTYGIRPQEKSLPARTTLQVAGLPVPGALVEIEAVAARHAAH
jgi:enamine deaminase RidA (YjgF/YER057c/UK114 family)